MNTRLAYAVLVFFIVLGLGIGTVLINRSQNHCSEIYRSDTLIKFSGGQLRAEKEQTEASREKGLGGRRCIANNQAMLFVFDKPGYYPFWMKDMKFNIDMVWLNSGKQVVYAADNVSPSSYPRTFVSDKPAQYVVEVAAGQASKLGLVSGRQLFF
jgi:hypothetical protein